MVSHRTMKVSYGFSHNKDDKVLDSHITMKVSYRFLCIKKRKVSVSHRITKVGYEFSCNKIKGLKILASHRTKIIGRLLILT